MVVEDEVAVRRPRLHLNKERNLSVLGQGALGLRSHSPLHPDFGEHFLEAGALLDPHSGTATAFERPDARPEARRRRHRVGHPQQHPQGASRVLPGHSALGAPQVDGRHSPIARSGRTAETQTKNFSIKFLLCINDKSRDSIIGYRARDEIAFFYL
jgi:hypothetical protein